MEAAEVASEKQREKERERKGGKYSRVVVGLEGIRDREGGEESIVEKEKRPA